MLLLFLEHSLLYGKLSLASDTGYQGACAETTVVGKQG